MERGNLNVIVFEDDEPSIKDHRQSRTAFSSKQAPNSSQHHIDIIEQEIQYLTDKMRNLERQADSLSQLKNDSHASHRLSTTNADPPPAHSAEIILAIEKKIQIIVSQTRKIVDQLGEAFEKKLQSKIGKKYEEAGVSKAKENYSKAVVKIEEEYRREIQRINREHKEQESRMLARVSTLEQNIINRMNQFQIKEKQYIDWIHHLEIQLQDKPKEQKSKKMIELTHANKNNDLHKKENQHNSSLMTGDNCSGLNPKSNNSQVQENSKIQRRHRIFDAVGAKTSSSVSPNTKVVSPISCQPTAQTHSSKIINPMSNRPQPQNESRRQQSEVNNAVGRQTQGSYQNNPVSRQTQGSYQNDKPGLVIERMTEPLKVNYRNERESSPWKVMDTCSVEKSHGQITKRKQIVKDVNASEFYKDIPKANQGWEDFQNYNQNEESSSDSEEDVIFYRNDEPKEDWRSNKESKWKASKSDEFQPVQPQEQRVFSPFDLN